jgi:peptidoglycan-associated lipoprotein
MRQTRIVLVVLMAAFVAGACARRPPAPPAAPATTAPTSPAPAGAGNAGAGEAAERARLAAEEAARREEIARAQAVLSSIVHFDYDSYAIREDSRRALDAKVPVLRAHPNVRIRIVGHTDERGSTEYNLALGMRRAQAVQEYLGNFGISPNRLEVESFGEERPLDPSSDEAAWARNRRAEFEVVSGF